MLRDDDWAPVAANTLEQKRARRPAHIMWVTGEIPDLPHPTPHDPYEERENEDFLADIYPEWTL